MSTNAVHALGALLFEMEVIRGYLEPHELPYFDATLAPAQNSSIKALNRLQGKISPWIIHSLFKLHQNSLLYHIYQKLYLLKGNKIFVHEIFFILVEYFNILLIVVLHMQNCT